MSQTSSKTWTDRGGVAHDFDAAGRGRRVVSLVPSLTETFCAVGGRERLVGCTAFCIRPGDVLKDLTVVKVGGTKTVFRERTLSLNPDLILLNLEENELDDIEFFKSRVECYVNGVKTLEEGIATICELAALIGTKNIADPLADQAVKNLAELRKSAAEKLAGIKRPRIFYAIWRDPWMTINRDTFVHDHLQICGAENVFGDDTSSRYPKVTLEQIRAAQPDIIWLPSEPFIFKEKHKADFATLTDVPAVKNGRVELVDGDDACWFGVRQIDGMAHTFRQMWKLGVQDISPANLSEGGE